MSTEKRDINSRNKIASLLFRLILILSIFAPIYFQKYEYNKYVILFNGILLFIVVFFLVFFIVALLEIKLNWGSAKQFFVSYFALVFVYFIIALSLNLGVYSTLNSFFPEAIWESYPEYGTYMIPTFSLSMVLTYRILNDYYFSELAHKLTDSFVFPFGIEIQFPIKEMKSIMKSFIIGLLFISFSVIGFSETTPAIITDNLDEFIVFSFISSITVASIELLILFLKNYLPPEEIKDLAIHMFHPGQTNKEYNKKLKKIAPNEKRKFLYICIFTIILLSIAFVSQNSNPVTSGCYNATVLEIDIKEIDTEIKQTSINDTSAIIPLVTIADKEKPLTNRIEDLKNNGFSNIEYSNKALDVSTGTIMYPLTLNVREKELSYSNKTVYLYTSLDAFPSDYDASIIYSFYKTGYKKCYLTSEFRDHVTMVFAKKIFFNLDEENRVAVIIDVTGYTTSIGNYDITILTSNQTIGKEIKNILEHDQSKANVQLLDSDPINLQLFNSSTISNTQ